MNKDEKLNFICIEKILQEAKLVITPSELHGVVTGLVCSGVHLGTQWLSFLYEFTNNGEAWSEKSQAVAKEIMEITYTQLNDAQLSFNLDLILPNAEDGCLADRVDSLAEWVSSYISSLGVASFDLDKVSEDMRDAFHDLSEIAKIELDEQASVLEQESLFEQILEHVKVSVFIIYSELQQKANNIETHKELH